MSKLTQGGERIEIPERASNITVQPVDQNGTVRVTYLTPMVELSFETDQEEQQGQKYVD